MKIPRKVATAVGVVSAVGGILTFAASPALAVSGVLLPTIGVGGSGPHHVVGHCTPGAGVATNLNQISYAIVLDATSFASNGSIPVGTSGQCIAYNTNTNHVYGSVSGGLPGGAVTAVGIITVPTNANAALCVKANALFNDNGTASFDNCPF